MKKQLISTAIAFIMVVNLVLVPDGAAVFNSKAAVTIYNGGDGWWYALNSNGTATIAAHYGSNTSVTIPSSIGGKTVTVVGSGLFAAFSSSSSVKSVTIPNSVTSIDFRAFYECTNLKICSV